MTDTVDFAQKTVTGTVDYASKTVSGAVGYANKTVSAAQNYASQKANSAVQFGKFVVKGATTTVTAYTPGPILNLVTSSVEPCILFDSLSLILNRCSSFCHSCW